MERQLQAFIHCEQLYIPYQSIWPGVPGSDIYRADFHPAVEEFEEWMICANGEKNLD